MTELPAVVPVFAVPGALLLPGGRLPLTVFEPRYLALTDHCLGAGRLLALVQPTAAGDGPAPGLYTVGCLARVVAFGETGDGPYLITCQGITRFRIAGEAEGRSGYRRVLADYRPFAADLGGEPDPMFDRRRLIGAVSACLSQNGLSIDLAKLESSTDRELITTLAMAAPLSPEAGSKIPMVIVPANSSPIASTGRISMRISIKAIDFFIAVTSYK